MGSWVPRGADTLQVFFVFFLFQPRIELKYLTDQLFCVSDSVLISAISCYIVFDCNKNVTPDSFCSFPLRFSLSMLAAISHSEACLKWSTVEECGVIDYMLIFLINGAPFVNWKPLWRIDWFWSDATHVRMNMIVKKCSFMKRTTACILIHTVQSMTTL